MKTKPTAKRTSKPRQTPTTTQRSAPPNSVAPSTLTTVSTPTTNSFLTSKGTAPVTKANPTSPTISTKKRSIPTDQRSTRPTTVTAATKPATSRGPSKTKHITFTMPYTIARAVAVPPYIKNPSSLPFGLQHVPQQWACLPHCQVSCTTLCPQACCMETPLHHPGVYSFPVLPQLQTVSRYQCAHPCSNACAPRCSSKCCNALYYRSPLFGKRKDTLNKRKKHKLHRGRQNLLQLKKVVSEIKESRNSSRRHSS